MKARARHIRLHVRTRGGRRRSLGFTTILVLLAFAWQSFLTQTHVHFVAGDVSRSVGRQADAALRLSRASPPADASNDCLLCREIAHAGRYLPPTPMTWARVPVSFCWLLVSFPLCGVAWRRSHGWHSRGPPDFLRA